MRIQRTYRIELASLEHVIEDNRDIALFEGQSFPCSRDLVRVLSAVINGDPEQNVQRKGMVPRLEESHILESRDHVIEHHPDIAHVCFVQPLSKFANYGRRQR